MLITASKRSLRRLCFYRCLSVHRGGIRGCRGACVAKVGGMHGEGGIRGEGGHVWWRGVCVAKGACVAKGGMHGKRGGMHGKGGVCMVKGGMCGEVGVCAWDMTRYGDTINEPAVRILLECILVSVADLEGWFSKSMDPPERCPLWRIINFC